MIRLHLRARGFPLLAAGLLLIAVLTAAAARAVDPWSTEIALTPMMAALLIGPTLAGADEALERGMAVRWPYLRAGHLILSATGIALVLALAGQSETLFRATLGYAGLVAAAAVVFGARLAWAPALGHAGAVYLIHPSGDGIGWAPVLAVFTAGTALYILRGAKT